MAKANTNQEISVLQELDLFQTNIQQKLISCDTLGNKIFTKTQIMHILHLNIRSFSNEFITWLESI